MMEDETGFRPCRFCGARGEKGETYDSTVYHANVRGGGE